VASASTSTSESHDDYCITEKTKNPASGPQFREQSIDDVSGRLYRIIKELDNGLLERAQLGLGHSYSRAKVSVFLLHHDLV
jgi:hypothetical protein